MAETPDKVVQALRMGRMTGLQKPSGGVDGTVVVDHLRRMVTHTLAQQLGPAVFALTNTSRCECVAHIAQALTDLDATVCGWHLSFRSHLA